MRIFPDDTLQLLEFDKVISEVAKHCESTLGLDRVQKVRPLDREEEIVKLLQQTKEMTQVLVFEDKFPEEKYFDIREILKFIAIENYVLQEEQFHAVRKSAVAAGNVIKFFKGHKEKYPALSSFSENVLYEKNIAAEIGKILDDDGKIRPNASPELIRIRKDIDASGRELNKAFTSALNKYRKAGFLSDVEESMRNNRRVLGIQNEYKRQLRGIIHDESETGKTIFIEPEEVVNVQNTIFELEREEKREIYRILKQLTQTILPYKDHLQSYQHLLSVIDFTRAKAKYALDIDADLPAIEKAPVIYLYHARHPVLFKLHKKQKKEVVPLDVELDENKRILVISGPNAGGKSVAMKTIGLLQVMLQSGLLIPAANQSRVGIFKNLFCDIGDTQSLEDELSTYSARLMKMKYFLLNVSRHTLFLIDEFGSGTDPVLGGAIAEAALDAINAKKAFGVITTHYANLKAYAGSTHGIFNGSMLFDESELIPLYRLETGKPGSSYAFEIAKKTALPQELIDAAKKLVSSEHIRFEELLKNVRIEKEHIRLREKEVTKKEADIAKKEEELQASILKAKEKEQSYNIKKMEKEDAAIAKMEEEFRALLDNLKNSEENNTQPQKEKIRSFLTAHRKDVWKERKQQVVQNYPQYKKGELRIGGPVKLISGSETGILQSIGKKKATVIFNNLITTVPVEELIGLEEIPQTTIKNIQAKVEIAAEDVPTEIDLRGKPKEEAMMELEQYLDRAMLRNLYQARIVHGKGTGVLREAVQYILKKHRGVKSFQFAERNMGGDGVTVVEF